jgi:Protein of unknown function (DUF3800)
MYIDESGDCGLNNSPKRYFVLTGLIVHETKWQTSLNQLINFRRQLKQKFGIKLREELHAYELISRPKELARIKKHERLAIIRDFANKLALITDIQLINIVIDKKGKPSGYDVFEKAWKALIQRFENTLQSGNFSNPAHPHEHGIILPDHTDNKKLTQLLRKMRHYNPVPSQIQNSSSRNLVLTRIAEDPNFRDSAHSYFVQATDLVAYLLQQMHEPNQYMKKKSGHNYFKRLNPVLCKVACNKNSLGIVTL